jgi:hypothetical protein
MTRQISARPATNPATLPDLLQLQLLGLAAAYGLPPSAFEIDVIARCARTVLPASSSGGETTAMPHFLS